MPQLSERALAMINDNTFAENQKLASELRQAQESIAELEAMVNRLGPFELIAEELREKYDTEHGQWVRENAELVRQLNAERKNYRDLQDHSYHGQIVKCLQCGHNLTSLLMCPQCGIRYVLVEEVNQ